MGLPAITQGSTKVVSVFVRPPFEGGRKIAFTIERRCAFRCDSDSVIEGAGGIAGIFKDALKKMDIGVSRVHLKLCSGEVPHSADNKGAVVPRADFYGKLAVFPGVIVPGGATGVVVAGLKCVGQTQGAEKNYKRFT